MDGTSEIGDGTEFDHISAPIPAATKRTIRIQAAKEGRSMSELIRETLAEEFGDE